VAQGKQPNILLITSDQHRPDCYGFAGRNIRTPHLDALAAAGTHFTGAITPNVVCQPSRASILTGLLPLTHGVADNQVSLDPKYGELGWGRTLGDAGYRSAFIGKGHFGSNPNCTPYGAPENRAQSAKLPKDWAGPYMGFDEVQMMILGHWHDLLPCEKPPHGLHFEDWFWGHGDDGEAWRRWAEDFGPIQEGAQTWFSKLPAEWHSTHWVTERTCDFLEQRDADQPFCMWVSYPDPHHPFDCPEPWSRMYDPDEVDISPHHKRDLDRRPWWHRAALENEPQAKSEGQRILRTEYSRIEPQTDRGLAEITANYYGMISFIDDGVGQILAKLDDLDLAEDTMVIFTSDHGELLGDHGLYLKGPTPYEGLLRVGLIMRGPGIPANQSIAEPVSTNDLAATFYDWADVSAPTDLQSRSLQPVMNGTETRDVAYSEWDLHPARAGVALDLRTVRTKSAKLSIDLKSGAGELYNLDDDPNEMTNRFDDPGAKYLQKELTEMIHARPGDIATERPENNERSD
jgi:arylsulfatase A-like enzyme